MRFTLAVGRRDPDPLTAEDEAGAVTAAVALIVERYRDVLAGEPEDTVTLMGPAGLVTDAGERLDAFVRRRPALAGSDASGPGAGETPDCNGG